MVLLLRKLSRFRSKTAVFEVPPVASVVNPIF